MALSNRILAIDIGAASIKVAEFDFQQDHPVLCSYDQREYDEELTEDSRRFLIAGLLRQILDENSFQARKAAIGISGQAALTRFVKLPPVADEEHRVRQIVEFEAQQNVPFSMDEVLWDYQLIGVEDEDELEVMFVVIKNEIVEQITSAVCGLGLELTVVDIAPVACYNAARANHIGDDESAMVLNIGARSTNLLFADRSRFFSRTIPIAGHTISQQIAKEFEISLEEAEELKRRHGFVALGGAYEEPESEVATAVSKIVRTVMTRLHGEINRSINVYRAQHKGTRPATLYLTGGSSIMAYTDQFFAEKLKMSVSYLNPFSVVSLDPSIDSSLLQEKAHMFSEVIGLALRHQVQCPVEVSLIPKGIRHEQEINKRKPYVAAALVALLLIPCISWLIKLGKTDLYQTTYEKLQTQVQRYEAKSKQIRQKREETQQVLQKYRRAEGILEKRLEWPRLLSHLEELRPRDVWFDGIKAVTEIKQTSSRSEREPVMMDEGAGAGGLDFLADAPIGPSMMGRGGSGSSDTAVYKAILLTGNAIQVAGLDHDSGTPPSTPRPNDTPTPDFAPPAPPGGAESGASSSRQAVELEFLAALRNSELFVDDPNITKIISYEPPESFLNYSRFVIRAGFAEPLDVEIR